MDNLILIIGGGLLQVPAVKSAQEIGLKVAVSDANADAPAMQLADVPCQLDIYDIGGHETLVKQLKERYSLQAVFAEGADVEVTVAAAAFTAGLPGISVEAARNTKDKARMRACFDSVGIANPRWREVTSLEQALAVASEWQLPFVVKAVDNCASRGTTIVRDWNDLEQAVNIAIANSSTSTILLEECFVGSEQSVEILFDIEGKCHYLNVVDRIFQQHGVYALELGHVNPSRLADADKLQLFHLAERAAKAVGVGFGAFKIDSIWTEAGPRILEVTARLSGGFDCQYTTPLATGRNFIRAAMFTALGRPIQIEDLTFKKHEYAAAWAAWPKRGVVNRVDCARACSMPGVTEVFLRVKKGDLVGDYENCAQRPAFVIAGGKSWEQALENAHEAASSIDFIME